MKLDKGDQQFQDRIKLLLEGEKGPALDVGCGIGQTTQTLLDLCPGSEVSVSDINLGQLDKDLLNKVNEAVASNFNRRELPFYDNSFRTITCIEVIEHLENYHNLIRQMSRVIMPGGCLIISTPYLESLPQRIYYLFTGFFLRFNKKPREDGHITPINTHLLLHALQKEGFKLEKIDFNRGWIPLLRLEVPRSKLFGDGIILKLRKVEDE